MKKPQTTSKGLRIVDDAWPKLQDLIKAKGRVWLEKLIAREHRKLNKDAV